MKEFGPHHARRSRQCKLRRHSDAKIPVVDPPDQGLPPGPLPPETGTIRRLLTTRGARPNFRKHFPNLF